MRIALLGLSTVAAISACAPEPSPLVPGKPVALVRAPTAPAPELTKEEHAALEAELGVSVVRALDGQLPRPASVRGAKRGETRRETSLDYSAIPLMVESKPARTRDAVFRIDRRVEPSGFCAPGEGTSLWFGPTFPKPTNVRVAAHSIPMMGNLLVDADENLFTVVALGKPVPIEWTSVDESARTADEAEVTHDEGTLDVATLVAASARHGNVHAEALAAGAVYTYRRCVAGCDAPLSSTDRVEEITLLGPPATWQGTSAPTERQGSQQDTAFSDASVQVRAGSSASLFVAFSRDTLTAFRKGPATAENELAPRTATTPAAQGTDLLTYSLEVVWGAGEEPTAIGFSGAFHGSEADLIGAPRPRRPSCALLR